MIKIPHVIVIKIIDTADFICDRCMCVVSNCLKYGVLPLHCWLCIVVSALYFMHNIQDLASASSYSSATVDRSTFLQMWRIFMMAASTKHCSKVVCLVVNIVLHLHLTPMEWQFFVLRAQSTVSGQFTL